MRTILHGIVLLGAVQSLFLATLLINRGSNSGANRVYAAIQLLASLALALAAAIFTGVAARHPWIHVVEEPISWLFGPLVYLYGRILLTRGDTLRRRDYRHFLPFAINLIAVIPVLWWEPVVQLNRAFSDSLAVPTLLRFAHGMVYSGAAFVFVLRNRFHADRGQFRWLIWFIGLTGAIWFLGAGVFVAALAGAVVPYPFEIATPLAGTIVIYVCGYISLRQPAVFAVSRSPRGPSSDADMDLIVATMEAGHLWRDPDLTVDLLARHAGLPAYRVSRAINSVRNESFFSFVNRYRVREVQEVLAREPAAPLLDTALAAGFNTKSSFNAVFKRFTGTTPSHYRRQQVQV